MINRIIDFSVKNKFIVFTFVAVAAIAGWWSMNRVSLDAIPDLSDTQVIIFSRWDRGPDIIEDQVTYPIVTAMLGAPRAKSVLGIAEVAPLGGFQKQYQVNLDPNRLQAYGISIKRNV